jgi:hypothetical protein
LARSARLFAKAFARKGLEVSVATTRDPKSFAPAAAAIGPKILAKKLADAGKAAGAHRPLETSRPGIFAVGDVRAGSAKRVASAAGEGSVVVSGIYEFLGEQITGLGPTSARAVPQQPTSVRLP